MFKQEKNVLKQEINAFYGHPWKNYRDNEPMISFSMVSGRGESVDQFLNLEEAQQVIELLQSLIEEAKALPDEDYSQSVFNDEPF